jgi:hypothetical protein
MYRLLNIFLLLSFLFFAKPALSQTYVLIEDELFREDARQAIDSLYNRNETAAKEILKPWIDRYPSHPLWGLWDAMELWWYVLDDLADDRYDEEFFNRMSRADYDAGQVLRRENDHPDALIIRAVANGYAARQNANRGNWITSVNIARRAYQAYTRLMEVVPEMPDNDFALGLKRYYAAYMPEKYPVVRAASWFLPDGDKTEGIKSLQKASREGVFARPEANYFLGFILLNYENRFEEASGIFRTLVEDYPDNGYYRRLYVRTLFHLGEHDEGRSAAEEALAYWEVHNPDQRQILHEELYYWLGRFQMQRGETEDALESFKRSYRAGLNLPNTKERMIHTLSAYYSGRNYEILNQKEEAERYYRFALNQNTGDETKRVARSRLDQL